MDKLSGMLPFLALGALGVADLVATIGTLRGTRRAEELGEGRFEPLRNQHERLELLREERRMLLDDLERERRQRLEVQGRVKQLMREHPHLEPERVVQRLTEELALEREGHVHNHRERQCLGEEVERERLARLGDQRNVQRIECDLQELRQVPEERQLAVKVPKRSLWTKPLEKATTVRVPTDVYPESDEHFGIRSAGSALARYTPNSIKWPDHKSKVLAPVAVCPEKVARGLTRGRVDRTYCLHTIGHLREAPIYFVDQRKLVAREEAK